VGVNGEISLIREISRVPGTRNYRVARNYRVNREYMFHAPLFGTLNTWSYAAGNQNATNSNIVTGTMPASAVAGSITLPAESMTILRTQ